jgi:hypothetical protein
VQALEVLHRLVEAFLPIQLERLHVGDLRDQVLVDLALEEIAIKNVDAGLARCRCTGSSR